MKNYMNKIGLCVLWLALFATACQEQDQLQEGHSGLLISLAEEVPVGVESRTVTIQGKVFDTAHLTVTQRKTGRSMYDEELKEDNTLVSVAEGVYDVAVSLGENVDLGVDTPYYEGRYEGAVVEADAEAPTEVNVTCGLANALLSVRFGADEQAAARFDKFFSDYHVQVSVGRQSVAIKSEEESKKVYFKAGTSLELVFEGSLREPINGTTSYSYQIPSDQVSVQAKDHTTLTLALVELQPGLSLEVVKAEVNEETISSTIPMAWLPKPEVSATGFDTGNQLSVVETVSASATLDLKLPSALQEMKFVFAFADEHLGLSAGKEYLLSRDKKALEAALGMGLPTVGVTTGKTQISLDELITNLQTNKGETTVNTLTVSVMTNNRWSDEKSYTLECTKPEFQVSVYPGNIWTKEFTVNALTEEEVLSGNYDRLSEQMSYQYSTDQSNWTTMASLTADKLTPGTKYYVRGLYRGEVPGNVLEMQTYPVVVLENGDMEQWKAEERGYYYNPKSWGDRDKLRTYYPWSGDSQYWNTNNDFTTRYRDMNTSAFSTVYKYNSFPAVSYTKDVHGGNWAAELRNTAAGRGNVSSSSSSYDFNNVPGELFIGQMRISTEGAAAKPNDSYEIDPGAFFASRPTALKFYYKYVPYEEDLWIAYIALYNDNNQIIAEGEKTNSENKSSYTEEIVELHYIDDMEIIPAKIYIYFASSIYKGGELPYHSMDVTTWYNDTQRTDKTLSGSMFFIDDVELIYDK